MRSTSSPRPVIVGVDGSPGSIAALRFALEEGLARRSAVQVITTWLVGPPMQDPVTDARYAEEADAARRLQDAAVLAATTDMVELPVITRVVVHDVGGSTLIDAAREGSVLVVGSGRKGALSRAFLGSVSEFCVRHASVPVVVVPDPARLAAPATVELVRAAG